MKSSRLIAFETLYKIFQDKSYSNIALDSVLKKKDCDKQFVSALVYGVVERKITLDYFIKKYTTGRIKPKVNIILQMGAYQLLFMDKVPSNSAVDESVKLSKEVGQEYYSKLVNAVLHKIDLDRQLPDDLSVKYSVPEHLLNMWIKQYSKETVEKFLPCINDRPPVFAIPNTLYVDADELVYELACDGIESEAYKDVVKIESAFDLSKSKAFQNGLFYIEDLSSYECACALNAKDGETVIDVCSAPGGKAFASALKMNNIGTIYAFDLYEQRVSLIDKSANRLGIDIIKTDKNDALEYNDNIPQADRVLCDVPCSGFGIIRRKPEIRYKDLDSVKELPSVQLKILQTSSLYVKSCGTLVYSTCTLNKKENEKVVSAFLNNNKSFTLVSEKTTFPSIDAGDGFYYAVMVKNEN